MKILVIGGFGKVGSALVSGLQGHEVIATGRNQGHIYDLRYSTELPDAEVAYIVACSINESVYGAEDMWLANVDGTIKTIQQLERNYVFPVFLSTTAVYHRHDNYAVHKRMVESYLYGKNAAIVRIGDVISDNLPSLVNTLKMVGENRIVGVTVWK